MGNQTRKRAVVDAARACFSRFGYDKTTLDDVGERVGLNKASLYHYFSGKEALFLEVMRTDAAELVSRAASEANRTRGVKKRVLAYIKSFFAHSRHTVAAHGLTPENMRSIRLRCRELFAQLKEEETAGLYDILAKGVEDGEIAECDARRVARIIMATVRAFQDTYAEESIAIAGSQELTDAAQRDAAFGISLILDGLRPARSSSKATARSERLRHEDD